jgi:hypothetical protein
VWGCGLPETLFGPVTLFGKEIPWNSVRYFRGFVIGLEFPPESQFGQIGNQLHDSSRDRAGE